MNVTFIYVAAVLVFLLICLWSPRLGFSRGVLAGLARALWLAPLVTLWFPKSSTVTVQSSPSLKAVNVLIDDSNSMNRDLMSGKPVARAMELQAFIQELCAKEGCRADVNLLSKIRTNDMGGSRTDLYGSLKSMVSANQDEPWIVFSDGGDMNPARQFSRSELKNSSGLIVGLGIEEDPNAWVTIKNISSFGFAGKPIDIELEVGRTVLDLAPQKLQLQIFVDGKNVVSQNVDFRAEEKTLDVDLKVPATDKGHHLVTAKVVAIAGERLLWDNSSHAYLETVPNTIGLLHLSGSPTPDARYMRRFIKAEPKFDLISFFILRDPWDSQFVNERELSLIPFPSERLFTQELQNFKLVVIQNFRMLQFLSPEYQQNLADFVENGGGLLFIGGPRAFGEADLSSKSLKSLLPFSVAGSQVSDSLPSSLFSRGESANKPSKTLPWYDENKTFTIEIPDLSESERELATIYEDFTELKKALQDVGQLQGLHHSEQVIFNEGEHSHILVANSEGEKTPLLTASYPGKGRALWVFTDSLWKVASSNSASRDLYNQVNQKMVNWLIRDDIRKPLSLESFDVFVDGGTTHFKIDLIGPALRYYENNENWRLKVCGKSMGKEDFTAVKSSDLELSLSGELIGHVLDGRVCELEFDATHKSFGQEKLVALASVEKTFTDDEMPYSDTYLKKLAQYTGAKLTLSDSDVKTNLAEFIRKNYNSDGVRLPPKEISSIDPYWFFDSFWWILALLGLPLEVLVRRWHEITGRA